MQRAGCCRRMCVYVDGYFPLGVTTCIVWATMDVLMCTASIWHMATISVDRYCSLRFPIRYRRTRTQVFVIIKIAFVWIVSIGICSPLAIAGIVNPLNVYRGGRCAPAVPEFVIYGSIFAFFIPLVVMLVSYALTARTLMRNAIARRREREKNSTRSRDENSACQSAQDGADEKTSVRSVNDRLLAEKKQTVRSDLTPQPSGGGSMPTPQDGTSDADANSHCKCFRSAASRRLSSTGSVKQNDDDNDQVNDDERRQHSANCRHHSVSDGIERQNTTTPLRPVDLTTRDGKQHNDNKVSSANHIRDSVQSTGTGLAGQKRVSAPGRPRPGGRKYQSFSEQNRRTKRKATRVLGVIFVVFVVLWTPFFVLNILSAVCPACVESVSRSVWTVLVWLGWISSFANPIIYTSFSPAFRSAFKHLLTYHCKQRVSLAERNHQWNELLRRRRSLGNSQPST